MFGILNITIVRCCLARMPFYAVRVGNKPGVYKTWPECEALVKGFPGARYKKFPTDSEAWAFVNEGSGSNVATASQSSHARGMATSTVTSATVNKRRLDDDSTESSSVVKRKYVKTTDDMRSVSTNDSEGEQDYVIVYTEGSCHKNSKNKTNAGIGVFWEKKSKWNVSDRLQGSQTNDRAEIHAAIKAVRQAKERGITNLDIHTDSDFLINCAKTFIKTWKKKGWKTSAGTAILNASDFEELDEELSGINVKWTHVSGHQDVEYKEMAEKLAKKGADSKREQDYVIVYTDGSCRNNGRSKPNAGIGVFWGENSNWNVSDRLQGRQTNNRAEIYAAIKAVRQAKERGITNLDIHTDSNFLINSITTWIKSWKKKDWKTSAGTAVLNRSDFEELDEELTGINVKWTHVRGHQGIEGNEMADKLANTGAAKPYIFPKDDDSV